jgi:hypothetical protein
LSRLLRTTEGIKDLTQKWNLWELNSVSIDLERVYFIIIDNSQNFIGSLLGSFNFQKWMIMAWSHLAVLTQVEVSTNGTFVPYTLDIGLPALVASDMSVDDVLAFFFLRNFWTFNSAFL